MLSTLTTAPLDHSFHSSEIKDGVKPDKEALEHSKEKASDSVTVITISTNDHYLAIATFCLIGITQLLLWNCVINSFVAMETYIWPQNLFSDILGGCEHAAALLVSVIMIKFNGTSVKWCNVVGVVNCFLFLIFPLVPEFMGGNINIVAAKVTLAVISTLFGVCVGFLHVYGYAFASVLPTNYVGYVSTGNGLAGVYSFICFILFSEIVFPKTYQGQVELIWVFFACGALLSGIQVILFYILSQRPWFEQSILSAQKQHQLDSEAAIREWGERRSFICIFKDCWVQAFNASFTLFVTLLIFPVVGPFGWHKSYTITTGLNGCFQVVDLLTRFLPILGGWTNLSRPTLLVCVVVRPLIMIPLFIVPNRLQSSGFLGETWWLFVVMAIFTATNGWFTTLGSIYCPDTVKHPAEKEIAAEILVIAILVGITIGILMSKITLL